MKILIIEDMDYKLNSIIQFLAGLNLGLEISTARSFQSGLREIQTGRPNIVILDMTLPTSDELDGHSESRFRVFGGRDLLGEIDFEGYDCKAIVVTQFDHFGQQSESIDHVTLFKQLSAKFPDIFAGGIYFNNLDSAWQQQLTNLLRKVTKNFR